MSPVRAECKKAGMLCSVPTLRLRSSNPHHLAGESFSAQREPSLPVAGGKGTQDQPSTRKQRSRYIREGNTIKNSCKCNSGQRRRPPGFCWELCFWKLCSAQARRGPCWCSPLLHEHALSSTSSTSMLCLAHSDTLPGWEPQPQSRGRYWLTSHSKPGISSIAQGERPESSSMQTWKMKLCLPTRQSTGKSSLRNNKRRLPFAVLSLPP